MDDVEAAIAGLRAQGKLNEAATLAIERYGDEVLGFLDAMLRDPADSADAFAQACEDLWRGLPRFEARCSMKTWFYTLARHAASRLLRASRRERLTSLDEISDLAHVVHSRTRLHLQTEVKLGVAAIRDALDEPDRILLVLRVDRAMSWADIARVVASEREASSAQALSRAAARLRKRFQLVKQTIRERAIAMGLLPAGDPG